MKKVIFLVVVGLLFQCGGNSRSQTAVKKPVSIAVSSESISFREQSTRLAYVVDSFFQAISVIDTRREEYIDTIDQDDFDFTPIPVGGEPSAIVVDNSVEPQRIFVADLLNNQILGYALDTIDGRFISYAAVSLGGAAEGRNSRPVFRDEGGSSGPTITNIEVDETVAQNESWRIRFVGNNKYEVEGSTSGVQSNLATEDRAYTSDLGEISFFVSSGGERTTNGDSFFFSTIVSEPLTLASSPVDLLIDNGKLYILTKNTPSIIIFDLETLLVETTIAIPDANAVPVEMTLLNSRIYVSDAASSQIFDLDLSNNTFSTIATNLNGGINAIAAIDEYLYLLQKSARTVEIWNRDSNEIQSSLRFGEPGSSIFFVENEENRLAVVPNVAGNIDLIDVETRERFDTDPGDQTDFLSPDFFDVLPSSDPQLISVNTVFGEALTESWQLVFEGIVPGAIDIDGTVSGDQLTTVDIDFEELKVAAGDLLVIPSTEEEIEIESVDNATTLTLASAPSQNGDVVFEIRANSAYTIIGSLSGFQRNRVVSDETYTTDAGDVSLLVRSSFTSPATRGDIFSFETIDVIDPVFTGNQSIALGGFALTRVDGLEVAYVIQQGLGQISIVDMENFNLIRTL